MGHTYIIWIWLQNYILDWKNANVRNGTLKQGLTNTKTNIVILLVLTKNFLPQKLGRNEKEPLCHTIKRLIWVLSLNILLWFCLTGQITFFAELYKSSDGKTFAYIVLAMPITYVCICALIAYINWFHQNQQGKIRFLMISGLFLLFEISVLLFNYQFYSRNTEAYWLILFNDP